MQIRLTAQHIYIMECKIYVYVPGGERDMGKTALRRQLISLSALSFQALKTEKICSGCQCVSCMADRRFSASCPVNLLF